MQWKRIAELVERYRGRVALAGAAVISFTVLGWMSRGPIRPTGYVAVKMFAAVFIVAWLVLAAGLAFLLAIAEQRVEDERRPGPPRAVARVRTEPTPTRAPTAPPPVGNEVPAPPPPPGDEPGMLR